MKINVPYNFGDVVYLKTDNEQRPHEVVGIVLRPGPATMLELSVDGEDITLYDFQVTQTRDLVKKFTSDQNNDD